MRYMCQYFTKLGERLLTLLTGTSLELSSSLSVSMAEADFDARPEVEISMESSRIIWRSISSSSISAMEFIFAFARLDAFLLNGD
eukprot:m.126529 g.126529  ORF g.126529 m.126529 type:complete len:85 (-) comp13834_c0_seq2:3668-3922(-)